MRRILEQHPIFSTLLKVFVVLGFAALLWSLWPRSEALLELDALNQQAKPVYDAHGLFAPSDGPLSDGTVELLVNLENDREELYDTIEAEFGIDLRLNSVNSEEEQLYLARVKASQAEALLEALEDLDGVEHAELNGQMAIFATPNDPLYAFQWNFDQVNAEAAWDLANGDGVVVAVLDTGVAFEDREREKRGILVPDLRGTKLRQGYDFVDDDELPFDQHGHGTHVAGTIAQATNNEYGVSGLAHGAHIMPVRVLDARGSGSWSDIAEGIRFATEHGAKVINLSLGGTVKSKEIDAAVRYAHEHGVVIVAAAGNAGSRRPHYPAAYEHVIGVAATQFDKTTTFYSNYGPYIDLAAPGGNTRVDQNGDGKPDGILQETLRRGSDGRIVFEPSFSLYMGTSMACPHVAAAAAMLIQNGTSHPDAVAQRLYDSAADAGEAGWDERFGHGILDVHAALLGQTVKTGSLRLLTALLLAAGVLFYLARRRQLGRRPGLFFGLGWALGAGLLFALPLLLGRQGLLGLAAGLGEPLMMWDRFWAGSDGVNPLLASALPAFLAVATLLGHKRGADFAAGLAIACAAVLGVEAITPSVDVLVIPGVALLDRLFLSINALFCLILGALTLKRD